MAFFHCFNFVKACHTRATTRVAFEATRFRSSEQEHRYPPGEEVENLVAVNLLVDPLARRSAVVVIGATRKEQGHQGHSLAEHDDLAVEHLRSAQDVEHVSPDLLRSEVALSFAAPHTGVDVETYLDRFVANTSNLTVLGVVWLAVTAIMLLSTIESAFNAIWRVDSPRPLMMRLIAYWTTLTLGPLLLGAGLSLSTVFFTTGNLSVLGIEPGVAFGGLARVLPFVFAAIGFTVIYLALPHRRVH